MRTILFKKKLIIYNVMHRENDTLIENRAN